jgi:hypothetical protein
MHQFVSISRGSRDQVCRSASNFWPNDSALVGLYVIIGFTAWTIFGRCGVQEETIMSAAPDVLVSIFVPAAFGSGVQELLYWYDSRRKLFNKIYQAQLQSIGYWVTIALMILGTGIAAVIWFAGQHPAPKDCMLLGASFPALFKHAVSATGRSARLGTARTAPRPVWSYFTQRSE